MKCKICGGNLNKVFSAIVLKKYSIDYFKCDNCGFIRVEEPYWLEEAYKSPINVSDTGLVLRNLYLSRKVAVLLYFLFGRNEKYLDYAGGYGLFTRLMRDIGFDFYHYDPYTENLFAKGFEANIGKKYSAITTFETFEHFVNPLEEIEKMLAFSENIVFTTELLSNELPKPNEWWYYGLEHGQHVSFYSFKTLSYIANKYGLYFISNERIHLFSKRVISNNYYKYLLKMERIGLFSFIKGKLKSKTQEDSGFLKLK